MTTFTPNWKASRTKRVREKVQRRWALERAERNNKATVRRRDRGCRFPLCGCKKLGLRLEARPEVSHDKHKAMGGNPAGDRSVPELMVQLCVHRHQDGFISRHKGTMRAVYLDSVRGYNGPVSWQVSREWMLEGFKRIEPTAASCELTERVMWVEAEWITLAHERRPGVLEPLHDWQRELLALLAEMEL